MLQKLLPIATTIAVCGATAATAQGMTISLGTPSLSGRVAMTEPVTVSCSPFDPSLTLFQEEVSVGVEQASGRSIASGSGGTFGFFPTLTFPCDNSVNTIPVTLLANPTGPPFHGGAVVVTASAGATAGVPCFPGATTCFIGQTGQFSAIGPTTLRVH